MILSIYAPNNRQIRGRRLHDLLYEVPTIVKPMSGTQNGGDREMEKGKTGSRLMGIESPLQEIMGSGDLP